MSKRTYVPERGDFVWLNFAPSAGREIDKRRPALVLSPLPYNKRFGFCIAVPTTTDLTPGPFGVRVPDGLLATPSLVLCDFVKNFDWRERAVEFIAKCPADVLDEVTTQLLELVDPVYK